MASDDRTVHQRLIAILAELPPIGKTQKNVQQGFMFRGQDDVLNALNPLLAKHGVFVVPDVVDRLAEQRTTAKGSIMFEVNLHVRFTFYGAAGDSVTGSAWGEGTDMGDKATNKAMTMAFKYVLNQTFAISTAETPDADKETPAESVGRAKPAAKPKPADKPAAAAPVDTSFHDALVADVAAGISRLGSAHSNWSLSAVLNGATHKFGRPIESLDSLTDEELTAILSAMPAEQTELT